MKSFHLSSHRFALLAVLATIFATGLSGCSGFVAYQQGMSRLEAGDPVAGLARLKEAMEQAPGNADYRKAYFMERDRVVSALLAQAERSIESGQFETADEAFKSILAIDPTQGRALAGQERVQTAKGRWARLDAAQALARAGDFDSAIGQTQQLLYEDPNSRGARLLLRQFYRQQADVTGKEAGIYPKLKAAFRKPVSLTFQSAPLQQVLDALKLASGLNYMLDKDVRPDTRVSIAVANKPVEDVLRLILSTNQLDRRVLDGDTVLIYPNTPGKSAEYKELVVRTFYLSNAEATKVAASLKTLTKARDIVVDDKLNLVMVRDTSEVVHLAEKIIAALDLAEPEVMLDLEVLEVSSSRLLEMGIQWPDTISAGVTGAAGAAGKVTLDELQHPTRSMVQVNVGNPLVTAQLRSQVGDANLLANPKVRVRNKQTAKVLIGQRVPVITTTATANVGTSQSVNYLDVGLKLEIEPTINLDGEVSMKIGLEVSNIAQTIALDNGSQAYVLGTRNTSTQLRVRDGETNVLAGLIQRDQTHSNTGIPVLNELPLLNRLFGGAIDNTTRTEIVLLITPRVVRNLDVPGIGQMEFVSGTESSMASPPPQMGAPALMNGPANPNVNNRATPAPSAPQPTVPAAFNQPPLIPTSPGQQTQ